MRRRGGELLVVARGEHTVALLNRYPYNNGHLLVSPLRHVAELADLTADEHLEAMATLARFIELYARLIKAEGFNIGLNLGRAAGAGVPGHLHWHLVPRWTGRQQFHAGDRRDARDLAVARGVVGGDQHGIDRITG